MSLATRCTSCGTVFRVVQDQLKVSEGWVRCGRCDAVFNALEGLFDLQRDTPPDWTEPPAGPATSTPGPGGTVDLALDAGTSDEPALEHDPSLVDRIDEQLLGPRRSGFGTLGGLGRSERRDADFADARFDSVPPDEPTIDPLPPMTANDSSVPAESVAEDDAPGFVRDAERRSRWQSSRARKWMVLASVLLFLLLAGQAAHTWRDELSVRWPPARAGLQTWCGWVGCQISAPRRLDDLSVESTALVRAGAGAEGYRLSVALHNRGDHPVALPWLDLTLTDANGELVARRALSPQELQATAKALNGRSDLALTAWLSTGAGRISGYTVELFYP